ncbi:MAG: hypothetical protein JW841_11300 [Deltaproteobacteria bacterium]|nr:hypothetical protein [Deltaproteobacteria bacterium]
MVFNIDQDIKKLRLAITIVALLLMATVIIVAVHEFLRHRKTEVIELISCDQGADRCASCHQDQMLNGKTADAPLAHRLHNLNQISCSCCHGGTAQALVADAAHLWIGHDQQDSRMREPYIQESCVRCHTVGIKGSEQLQSGAAFYIGLGCALCHGGRANGADLNLAGPKLSTLTRQSASEIKQKIFDPGINSVMPSYRQSLTENVRATNELIMFVQSLTYKQTANAKTSAALWSCNNCHVGKGGSASGNYKHRCPSLAKFACANCHAEAKLNSSQECPRITQERPACGVCHQEVQ